MKKMARLVAVLLCICMLFTSCAPVGTNGEKTADSEYSQEVQNLEKLCKVWGYVKYTHPVFLTGEKDWDAELITLIPKYGRQRIVRQPIKFSMNGCYL